MDLFFVLSGYLITTLLVLEWRYGGGIGFRSFWSRRAKRLFPALVLVLSAVSVVVLFRTSLNVPEASLQHFRSDALSSLFYGANWHFALTGQSYFDQFAGPSPLRHMWSLAIEEQFYLLWPLVLFLGLRSIKLRPPYRVARLWKVQRRVLAGAAAVGTFASAGLMALLYSPGHDPSRIYYGTDTRVQAILAGAFLAFALVDTDGERLRSPVVQSVGAAGFIGCFAMFRLVTDTAGYMYTGGFLLMALLAALAIGAAVGPPDTAFARALSWGPLTWIGGLSYGIYLWHWPVFVVLDSDRTSLGGAALLVLRVAVTLGVASASYYLVEAPIRFGALRRPKPRAMVLGAATACLALLAVGFVSVRAPASSAAASEPAAGATLGPPLKLLVVGDSVGQTLAYHYRGQPGSPPYSIKTDALLGCALGAGTSVVRRQALHNRSCDQQVPMWSRDIAAIRPDLALMLYGPWELGDMVLQGKVIKFRTVAFRQMLLDQLESARQVLTAQGAKMVILDIPCFRALDSVEGFPDTINQTSRGEWVNGVYRAYAARYPQQVQVIDLHRFLCPSGKFSGAINGVPYTNDGIHFNAAGAPIVWNWLRPQLGRLTGQGLSS